MFRIGLLQLLTGRLCSSKKVDLHEPANAHSSIGKVIGVVSGKGGVGKSLVTGSLARQMVKMGYKVGILDADITGPSIPKMYGIHEKAQGTQEGILPRIAKDGTKIMSVNLLLEDEDTRNLAWTGDRRGCEAVLDRGYVGRS